MKIYDPYKDFKKTTLSNGFEVYHQYWDRPWVFVSIVVHSGSREDPLDQPGLMHFVEHMVSENIPGFTRKEVETIVEREGGSCKFGGICYEAANYGFRISVQSENLERVFQIFSKMLLSADLKDGIEKERNIIHNEFKQNYNYNQVLDWEMELKAALFEGHRLETWNGAIGRPEGFMQVGQRDLQKAYNTHYVPQNMTMVVLGGLGKFELLDILNRTEFTSNIKGSRNPYPEIITDLKLPNRFERKVSLSEILNIEALQVAYETNWLLPATFRFEGIKLSRIILSRMISDFFREKLGLTYGFDVSEDFWQDLYSVIIRGKFDTVSVEEADEHLHRVIGKIEEERDLFEHEKNSALRSMMMKDASGRDIVRGATSDVRSERRIRSISEEIESLEQVTFEDIIEIFRFFKPEHQCSLIFEP